MSTTLRPGSGGPAVILVGAGFRGHKRALRWREAGGRLVAVVDSDLERAATVAREWGGDGYDSLAAAARAFPDAAIVDICTPPGSHKAIALEALELGRHVLCEKPFVPTAADAQEVMDAARLRSRHVVVMHNWLYLPVMLKTRAAIRAGKLGDVFSAQVSCTENHLIDTEGIGLPDHWVHRLAGGRAEETLPHLVYLLVDVLDDPTLEVRGVAATKRTPYPWVQADTLTASLGGEKTVGSISLTYGGGSMRMNLHLTGSLNDASASFDTQLLEYTGMRYYGRWKFDPGEKIGSLANSSARRLAAAFAYAVKERRGWPRAETLLMRQFIDCIEHGAEPPVSPRSAIDTVRLTADIVSQLQRSVPATK